MDIAELFAAAGAGRTSGPKLTDEQMTIRVKEWYAQVYETGPERFEPGQFISHKNPQASNGRYAKNPTIFVRYLDEPLRGIDFASKPEDLTTSSATMVFDCVILTIADDEICPEFFADSRQFTARKP